ncbi:MAG TPA: hypothetical protein VNF99_06385 [Stellaceae bacterium]|nr:hypothetical protein [Stellaceae bacterium]
MRLLTAASILCIGAITAGWGWRAAQFAQARAEISADGPGAGSLHAWVGVPGLSGEARETSLRQAKTAAEAPAIRAADLGALLAVHPMSAQSWASLAADRLVLGRPLGEVTGALSMSYVTGPNEGAVMWQRGMLGMLVWNALPADAQRQTIADLAGAMEGGAASDQGINLAKRILAEKPPDVQAEIANALGAAGVSVPQLAAIGLRGDGG